LERDVKILIVAIIASVILSGDSPEVRPRSFAALRMTARGFVILSAAKDLGRNPHEKFLIFLQYAFHHPLLP
jgi:hypothetical protein